MRSQSVPTFLVCLATMLVAWTLAAGAQPPAPLAVGDTVAVTADAAPMKVRNDVVAALKRGDRLTVERLWGDWLWTTVEVGGVARSGWVRIDQVRRLAASARPTLDAGDHVLVAAESADVMADGKRVATLPRRYMFIAEAVRPDAVATTVDVAGRPVQGWVSTARLRRVRPGEALPIEDGDQVVVTEPADVTVGGKRVATLPRRYVFAVEAARNDKLATTVDVGGKPTQGWVAARCVRRASPRDLPAYVRIWKLTERPLCTFAPSRVVRESLAVSPDGWRMAYAERVGDKGFRVVVDGQAGPTYELVLRGTPRFSADSRRVAYAALDQGAWRLVVDNFAGPPFERLTAPVLSPDGRHVACAALKNKAWRVLLDGQAGKPFEKIDPASLTFSPDGTRLAYAARQWDKWQVVCDGKPGEAFDEVGGIRFSPDSRRMLHVARATSRWHAVVDGVKGPPFDAIEGRAFSPNGQRVTYVARAEQKFRVVVDGFVGPACDGILEGTPAFSPDGRRVAYGVVRGNTAHVVLDGKAQRPYAAIAGLAFSPDSRRVAYAAQRGIVWHVVTDGVEGLPYDAIAKGTPVFSPDSRRMAFVARAGGRSMVVLDGQAGPTHDGVLTASPLFGPRGRHIAYVVVSGKQWRVAHDGRLGPPCTGIGAGTPLFSPDGRRMAYAAIHGAAWHLTLNGQPQPPHDEIGDVAFSPDSRHIAYAARDGDRWRLVIDGEPAKPYGGFLKGTRIAFAPNGTVRTLAWTRKDDTLTIWRTEHAPNQPKE